MIATVTLDELPAVAAVLARAFRDNPGMIGILRGDGPEQRARVLPVCMLGFARAVFHYGALEVVKRDDGLLGVAMAFPPGRFPPPLRGELMVASGVLRARPGRAHRFARAAHEMQKHHPEEPHWYLWFLGVEPERQGQGLGSELLRSLTAKADAQRQACYLETDRERNIPLYRAHGFTVRSDRMMPGMNAQMWFMDRPARR